MTDDVKRIAEAVEADEDYEAIEDGTIHYSEAPDAAPLPTMEDIEASRTEPSAPIYGVEGGEGIAATGARRLVAFVELPDRRKEDWQARNMLRDSDIREGMAQGALKLHAAYMQRNYNALGFVFDPNEIEYDITRLKAGMGTSGPAAPGSLARTLVATIVIRR